MRYVENRIEPVEAMPVVLNREADVSAHERVLAPCQGAIGEAVADDPVVGRDTESVYTSTRLRVRHAHGEWRGRQQRFTYDPRANKQERVRRGPSYHGRSLRLTGHLKALRSMREQ